LAESKIISGGKPDPDPTLLTTQALLREIGSLKELFDTRFSATEHSVDLIRARIESVITIIDEKIVHLKDLTDEKFAGIDTRFAEARYLTEQTSRNDKIALDAALQAQKEDVSKQNDSNNASIFKSEVLFTKQIDGLNDKIDDIKSRFIANDSQSKGKSEGIGLAGALTIGAAFIISALVSIAALIVSVVHH
jgi:hypothetical protein